MIFSSFRHVHLHSCFGISPKSLIQFQSTKVSSKRRHMCQIDLLVILNFLLSDHCVDYYAWANWRFICYQIFQEQLLLRIDPKTRIMY